jgi:hypothetical protein
LAPKGGLKSQAEIADDDSIAALLLELQEDPQPVALEEPQTAGVPGLGSTVLNVPSPPDPATPAEEVPAAAQTDEKAKSEPASTAQAAKKLLSQYKRKRT